MPITEVPMFRATCDVCGKDDGDDTYYAWADAELRERGGWKANTCQPLLLAYVLACGGSE